MAFPRGRNYKEKQAIFKCFPVYLLIVKTEPQELMQDAYS
jgi:hypothetical protein